MAKRESHLADREEAVRAREIELANKEEDLLSEAYKFRREFRCDHQVCLYCVFLFCLFCLFRIVLTVLDLVVSVIFPGMRVSVGVMG